MPLDDTQREDRDFKHLKASSQQLVAQYDTYKPFPDLAVKGQQTLGENIADLAGLTASYDAYHRASRGKPAPPWTGSPAISNSSLVMPRTGGGRHATPHSGNEF